jgi:hypothetical protein
MRRETVDSSNIASVGYSEADQVLEIEFKGNGAIHQYAGVPKTLADQMVRAPSIGRFFHQHVKGMYTEQKVA